MNTPESLRELTGELVRRGLPVEYSRRAAEELADHHRDLLEEMQAAGLEETAAQAAAAKRLGDTQSLVKKTVREFQRRHWCGRWPVLTFVVATPFVLYTGWMCLALVGWIITLVDPLYFAPMNADGVISDREWWTFQVMWFLACVALSIAIVWVYLRLASRAGLNPIWPLASCLILGVIQGIVCFDLQEEHCRGMISLVIGIPPAALLKWFLRQPWQAFQLFLPLVVAMTLVWRNKHQSRLQAPLAA